MTEKMAEMVLMENLVKMVKMGRTAKMGKTENPEPKVNKENLVQKAKKESLVLKASRADLDTMVGLVKTARTAEMELTASREYANVLLPHMNPQTQYPMGKNPLNQ